MEVEEMVEEEMAMAEEGACDGDDLGKCSHSRCQERTKPAELLVPLIMARAGPEVQRMKPNKWP